MNTSAIERKTHAGSGQRSQRWSAEIAISERSLVEPRVRLLEAVTEIATALCAGAAESDEDGRLVDGTVDALRSHGLWKMRLCQELEGFELPIVAQIEVLAALAAEDSSAAWCTMVANNAVATLGATMPAETIERVFADGIPACSIVATPGGAATPVDGGYLLNGTWRLASAIHHASWIHAVALVERDPSRPLPVAIPAADVELLDSWNVVGLAGTGSNDFKLTDYFLPADLAGREDEPFGQVRGRRRYDLVDVEHLESYEHLAFAIGVARRALRELRLVLAQPPFGRHIGDRELVQEQFGRSVLRLQAVEALAYSLYARIDAAALGEVQSWSPGERHLPRVLAAQASDLALECVQLAFRRSGLTALHKPNILEKLLRDMSVAAAHAMVDDSAFASYAQHLVESGFSFQFRGSAPGPTWEG
jgi:alkylation response protein AidB-like acyl-CoA dehydrogenase